jgi:hypothetical protein
LPPSSWSRELGNHVGQDDSFRHPK